eukprot:gene40231-53165_t
MLPGHKSMSQNEAEWQSNHRYRIQHTMEVYFPGVISAGFITEVMWNRYRQSRNLVQDPGYFFEDIFPGFELGGLTRDHHQIHEILRDLSFFSSTRSYTLAELRRRAVDLTHVGLMNFRFRRTETKEDGHVLVRLPREIPFPEDPPITNLGNIPWGGDDEDGPAGAMDVEHGQDWDSDGGYSEYDGPLYYGPPVPDDSDGIPRTPSKGPGPDPEPGASIPAQVNLAIQVPLMRPVGLVMALSSRAKGPRPD